jgi:methyl-accepting chemotaxis protein PixJ
MVDQIDIPPKTAASTPPDFPPVGWSDGVDVPVKRSRLQSDPLPQRLNRGWRRLSLAKKTTLLAITLGTLPVLGIGAIAYKLTDDSFRQQISATQQASAARLSDKVNRFMLERYGDIQVLARLPMLNIARIRESVSIEEKQAVLDNFLEAYNIYESIAVLDLDGNVVAQSKGAALPNQKDQAYFQAVRQGDSPYIDRLVSARLQQTSLIYLAAPVRDNVTGKTVAIVRTAIPPQELEDTIRSYQLGNREYQLSDSTNKVFLAVKPEDIGQDIAQTYADVAALKTAKTPGTFVAKDAVGGAPELVSYIPPVTLEGLPPLDWSVFLVTDTNVAFAPLRNLLTALIIGTGLTAVVVGAIAASLARRFTRPLLTATDAVAKLGQGQLDTRIAVQGEDELAQLGGNINQMAGQLQGLLQAQTNQTQQAQRLSQVIGHLRQANTFDGVLQTSVMELRDALELDRAIVYLFDEQWQGKIMAESVALGWNPALGATIADPCFAQSYVEKYQQGRIHAIDDIDAADLDACYRGQLTPFNVKANLVAPILVNAKLIGLLVAHQCAAPRQWQLTEQDFIRQVATQVGFALEQVQLLDQRETARQSAEALSAARQQQQEALQQQLLDLLGDVEGAASGDLTVRADVTAGEIGIVADFFNAIVESLRQIVVQVKQSAVQVNTALGQNEQAIRNLADTSLKQSQETTQTLDAVGDMVRSIEAVSASAQQAAMVTRTASSTAEAGGVAMDATVRNILGLRETIGETTKKVKRLGESSQQISKVVSLINQIAMQTNLLAINAGIEAARAGEDSQGFAVVAEEVADLATRSATATREIAQIVSTIQQETSEVVEAMEQGTTQVVAGTRSVEHAKRSLEDILGVSRQIDQLVQSISASTVSQVATSQTITQLMEKIAQVAGNTSESSLQVSDSLRQTVAVAQTLQESVGTFKVS